MFYTFIAVTDLSIHLFFPILSQVVTEVGEKNT